ncbi:hypothetical protein [Ochrobactrum sp. A-1]|uniref:hypothetical protein n=1 Tax=Ochrobactrum sp. A-1 TaxID=2920940 RepID=UPI0040454531
MHLLSFAVVGIPLGLLLRRQLRKPGWVRGYFLLWRHSLDGGIICISDLIRARQAGEVRTCRKCDFGIVIGQPLWKVGAIDGDNPVVGNKAGYTYIVPENLT